MIKMENDVKPDIKTAKSDKERSNKRTHKKEKQKPQTKIVIRHLPPTMSEAEFLQQIDPLPPHDFYYFAAADWSLGYDATCRAYISMKNYDDVFLFRDRFDGYVFVDSKGAEYPAIVEFAPFQGLKNKSRRVDNKVNSIEQESHYQNFITKLEEEREVAKSGECKLEFSLDRKKEEKITSTPLLQYLANKKEKRREDAKRRQEEKRRQRDEDKEKRIQVTKIISNNEGVTGVVGKNNKLGSCKENLAGEKNGPQQLPEEGKSSRSQRRAERNQRRREEFERKRQEREKARELKSKTAKDVDTIPDIERKGKEHLQHEGIADDGKHQQRKEGGKRYSERRERDRNRNRKDKEKDTERPQSALVDDEIQKNESTASEAMKAAAAAAAGVETIVSESVMNFIRSVATAKEFVPKYKQQKLEDLKKSSSREIISPVKDETNNKPSEEDPKQDNLITEEDTRTQKQRNADEQRRIRNKDRPSIAIYQPKARLRISEERDSSLAQNCGKGDTRSSPTSDCESIKKEETRTKKVYRYSERRAERRNNKEKQKNYSDSIELEPKSDVAQPTKLVENIESFEHLL